MKPKRGPVRPVRTRKQSEPARSLEREGFQIVTGIVICAASVREIYGPPNLSCLSLTALITILCSHNPELFSLQWASAPHWPLHSPVHSCPGPPPHQSVKPCKIERQTSVGSPGKKVRIGVESGPLHWLAAHSETVSIYYLGLSFTKFLANRHPMSMRPLPAPSGKSLVRCVRILLVLVLIVAYLVP